jgi:hypothetical protein
MKYGNMPLCDSWASIYAYKNEDLIVKSFLRCEHYVHPSIPNIQVQLYFNNQDQKENYSESG